MGWKSIKQSKIIPFPPGQELVTNWAFPTDVTERFVESPRYRRVAEKTDWPDADYSRILQIVDNLGAEQAKTRPSAFRRIIPHTHTREDGTVEEMDPRQKWLHLIDSHGVGVSHLEGAIGQNNVDKMDIASIMHSLFSHGVQK